jgi:hypothetical protein
MPRSMRKELKLMKGQTKIRRHGNVRRDTLLEYLKYSPIDRAVSSTIFLLWNNDLEK